jgi:proteasome maturation protein
MWLTCIFLLSFTGDDLREPPSFHDEMEKRLKMDF